MENKAGEDNASLSSLDWEHLKKDMKVYNKLILQNFAIFFETVYFDYILKTFLAIRDTNPNLIEYARWMNSAIHEATKHHIC